MIEFQGGEAVSGSLTILQIEIMPPFVTSWLLDLVCFTLSWFKKAGEFSLFIFFYKVKYIMEPRSISGNLDQ